jgi:hypothetical protein
MPIVIAVLAALLTLVMVSAPAADAQQVKIETTRKPSEKEARIVPPPLHYETSQPPDAGIYPGAGARGTKVEHDPAFIEPFAGSYQTSTGSGRYGLSGWTAPNPPIGSESTNWREVNGWFALGFSVTWDGPPARAVPAQRPR